MNIGLSISELDLSIINTSVKSALMSASLALLAVNKESEYIINVVGNID